MENENRWGETRRPDLSSVKLVFITVARSFHSRFSCLNQMITQRCTRGTPLPPVNEGTGESCVSLQYLKVSPVKHAR